MICERSEYCSAKLNQASEVANKMRFFFLLFPIISLNILIAVFFVLLLFTCLLCNSIILRQIGNMTINYEIRLNSRSHQNPIHRKWVLVVVLLVLVYSPMFCDRVIKQQKHQNSPSNLPATDQNRDKNDFYTLSFISALKICCLLLFHTPQPATYSILLI